MTRKITREATGFPGDEDYDEGEYAEIDALLGKAIPAVSWPEIGTTVEGVILKLEHGQARDPDGNPKTFPDGAPRMQVVITVQTELREDEDDDGRRRIFVKGGMVADLRSALQRADVPGPRPGGTIVVTYSADGEKKAATLNPPKLFTIDYAPPA